MAKSSLSVALRKLQHGIYIVNVGGHTDGLKDTGPGFRLTTTRDRDLAIEEGISWLEENLEILRAQRRKPKKRSFKIRKRR